MSLFERHWIHYQSEFRDTVIMYDLQDYTYKEIALAMNCPIGTVMSRLFRGRKLLRNFLNKYNTTTNTIPSASKDRKGGHQSTV
jgi:RNA polymerase sigma-70 factor (ECF subfamily)